MKRVVFKIQNPFHVLLRLVAVWNPSQISYGGKIGEGKRRDGVKMREFV